MVDSDESSDCELSGEPDTPDTGLQELQNLTLRKHLKDLALTSHRALVQEARVAKAGHAAALRRSEQEAMRLQSELHLALQLARGPARAPASEPCKLVVGQQVRLRAECCRSTAAREMRWTIEAVRQKQRVIYEARTRQRLEVSEDMLEAVWEPRAEEELLGFRPRAYVRDEAGEQGVVEGACPLTARNLLVSFASGLVSVAASGLVAEEAWQGLRASWLRPRLGAAQQRVERHRRELQASEHELSDLVSQEEVLESAAQKAASAVATAKKRAQSLAAVIAVKFKPRQELILKSWRDIGRAVSLSWAVEASSSRSRSILALSACRRLAKEVLESKQQGIQIFSAKQMVGRKWRKCSFSVSRRVAKRILKRIKAAPPAAMVSVALLKAALGALEEVVLDEKVQAFFDHPETGIVRVKEVAPPARLAAQLRPYQLKGYHWLVNNARNGLGCILADDMGLGKTLQAISLMLYMKEHHMLERPMLVVVPKGLLNSWLKELKQWAGDELRVHLYYENKRFLLPHMVRVAGQRSRMVGKQSCKFEKKEAQMRRHLQKQLGSRSVDVFLTSYGVCRSDVRKLALPKAFSGMILDEAQQIKNYNSKISKAVKEIAEAVGPIRIALSGTPVENKLQDLNSQFEYILPGYLASSRTDFQEQFGRPVTAAACGPENEKQLAQKRLLQRIVRPFILRRQKTDPEICKDLPEKIVQDHECELTDLQKKIYRELQAEFKQLPSRHDGLARQRHVFSMLQALRELCNHPALLPQRRRPAGEHGYGVASTVQGSGKCVMLMELLSSIMEGQEKVLIFSTSLKAIEMLTLQISENFNFKPLKLIGSMGKEQREAAVQSFQTDVNCPVMLLSLQAGGVGLNLTAASHVIHFDRQYNPAKEKQATDRAHRIGQSRTVLVHRLVSKGSFEEKLGEIIEQKQRLSDFTVQRGEGWIADLDDEQLRDLLSLSA